MEVAGIIPESEFSTFTQILISGINLILPTLLAWMTFDMKAEQRKYLFPKLENNFDFIVVGSGSAGSIVASRLSENFKVLLLEAGGTPHAVLSVPILTYAVHGDYPVDWKWRTVPQKNASFGMNDNVNLWPGGKVLGGSTNINGVIAIRGNVQGFDTIANLTGNPIWKMENMLEILKSQEDYHGYFDNADHGKGGHLSIEKADLAIVGKQFLKAGEELGYKIRDPNAFGPLTDGFAPMDLYVKHGRRWSAYHHYLKPIMQKRKNLTVRKYATVTKVLIDESNKAYGVEYYQNGRYLTAKCSQEVILSAGAIQSPKLMMLSGIGPRADLKNLGITVKMDLPVGQHLQDKYGAAVGPFLSDPNTSFILERDLNRRALSAWVVNGTGPIKSPGAQATFTVSSSMAEKGIPDIHAYFMAISFDSTSDKGFAKAFNVNSKILKWLGETKGQDAFYQLVTLNKCKGTGTLRLRDRDPFSQPLIDPKYLQNEQDVKVLIEGIKLSVKLVENTNSYKSINARLFPKPVPGCEKHEFKSDAYWECFARTLALSAYKYSGTAPMGRDQSDPDAVVDSELRVFGIRGLRVVDASVLQVRQVSVNHITVQGTAEAASRMIIHHWNQISSSFAQH